MKTRTVSPQLLENIFAMYKHKKIYPKYVMMFYDDLRYMEVASVRDGDGRIMNAHALSIHALKKMLKEIDEYVLKEEKISIGGLLKRNYLFIDHAPEFRFVFTHDRKDVILSGLNKKYPVNKLSLLFYVHGQTIHVYHYYLDKKSNMLLYDVDLPNIYNNGRICLGNIKFDLSSYLSYEEVEKNVLSIFFNTKFSDEITMEQIAKLENPITKKKGKELWKVLKLLNIEHQTE